MASRSGAIKSRKGTHWVAKLLVDLCAGGSLAACVVVGSLAASHALGMDAVHMPALPEQIWRLAQRHTD